jgi:hypothetical protein
MRGWNVLHLLLSFRDSSSKEKVKCRQVLATKCKAGYHFAVQA